MKKLLRSFICLLLICAMLPSVALGVGAADLNPRLRQVMTGMGKLVAVNKTKYLIAQNPKTMLWGVFTTDAEPVMDYLYDSLQYVDYDCFRASYYDKVPANIPLDYINSFALVNSGGTQLTDYIYGFFKVYNHHWAAGWILENATKEDYDYKYNSKHYYRIARCDVYYLDTAAIPGQTVEAPTLYYASFTRDQFKNAQAHERYLSIMDRQDNVIVIDGNFKLVNVDAPTLASPMFTVKNYAVCRPDGSIVMDGFTKVTEANTARGMLLIASWVDYSGVKYSSVFDLEGNMLMPPTTLSIKSVAVDYVVLAEEKKLGLYSLSEQRQIIPCAYDSIIANSTGLDAYVAHGYVCAERDGARYYIDVATGQETMMYVYDKTLMKVVGSMFYYTDENKQVNFCAADGSSFALPRAAGVSGFRGDGYLITYGLESRYRVDDWTGTSVVFNYSRPITITDDNKLIFNSTTDGYQLYELVSP